MTDQPIDPTLQNDAATTDVPKESARAILMQFVVFPLAIVAVAVGIFFLFGMLASEEHSIPEYVNDIRNGSTHRRWQAAYQLSKSLKRGEAAKYPNLGPDVIAIYQRAKNDDPKVRRYLSIVLGRIGDRRATPVLVEALSDPSTETRIYAMWALGELGDPASVGPIQVQLRSDDHDLRKTAVYVLGQLGSKDSTPLMVAALDDPSSDVRWNAALALSRFGDERALPTLRAMMDRQVLARAKENLREDQKEEAIISGMAAYAKMRGKEALPELQAVAQKDPSLRVQSAARQLIDQLR